MKASIEELVLRVPGLKPADASALADEVTRRIRAGLPSDYQPVSLPRVELRLRAPVGLARDALAERIARAVLDQLRPGGAS